MTAVATALGNGVTVDFVWNADVDRARGLPVGAVIHHDRCVSLYVQWSATSGLYADQQQWSLESLVPLSLDRPVECPACGRAGKIVDGLWLELEVPT